MPRILCYYDDCIYLEKGLCTAKTVELDPDDGCLSYSEDPGEIVRKDLIGDEEDVDYGESWEDAGYEEIDGLNFDDDEGY